MKDKCNYFDSKMKELNGSLELAILGRNKSSILKLYDLYEKINLEEISDDLFFEYDEKIDRANKVLFE